MLQPELDEDVKIYSMEGNAARKLKQSDPAIRKWVLPPDPMAYTQKVSAPVPHQPKEEKLLINLDAVARFRLVAAAFLIAALLLGLGALSRLSCAAVERQTEDDFRQQLQSCETAILRTDGTSVVSRDVETPAVPENTAPAAPILEFSAALFRYVSTLNFLNIA